MNESDPRATRSRTALLNAGVETLLQNSNATLTEIAQVAGVGRATLYRHFQTREQLIIELAAESLMATDQACAHIRSKEMKGREAIEAIFTSVMPLADRFHFLLSLWSYVETNETLKTTYHAQLSQLKARIKEAKLDSSIDESLPEEWLVCLMDNLLYTGWYCIATGSLSASEASKLAIRSFFDGMGVKTNNHSRDDESVFP